jgi:dolichol-phosphate mannosyltransferase
MSKISIIAPALNEEASIGEFYKRIRTVLESAGFDFEIIFIDDGSADGTLRKLKDIHGRDARVKIISFSRNFGHPLAISAGLENAGGDAAVIIDADLQDPPEALPEFFQKWREGYKVVYGIRTKRKEWFGKRLAYWCFYRLLKKLAALNLPLDAGDFCLMDREVIEVIKSLPERNRFMRGLRSWAGFKQTGVVYERAVRFAGVSKYSLTKLCKLALDGILAFSYIPLRLASFIGFIIAGFAFLAILLVLYLRLAYGIIGVPGFSSTLIAILFLGGIQLIAIGIVGEYIARIYEEVKHRPLYIVKEKIGL